MADNHYDPLPLHDFKVGEKVIFIDVLSSLEIGTIVAVGRRMISISNIVNKDYVQRSLGDEFLQNPIVGGPLIATVPFDFVWRVTQ